MIKHLKEKDVTFVGEGAYGTYCRINKSDTGVKILRSYHYDSYQEAKESESFTIAKSEFKRLKQLRKKTRLVPAPISMAIVEMKIEGFEGKRTVYKVGFIMTHVTGKPVANSRMRSEDYSRLEAAERTLRKRGIYRNDKHDFNVIKTRGNRFKYVFIDPDALRFKKEVEDDGYSW